ncbi:MAG: sulfite exporter TauE/SafE family protein [Pirellulaceae bacterium]|nr:sulfite exporter TauE/SafE family protein [Pirellulaceae bacterium]
MPLPKLILLLLLIGIALWFTITWVIALMRSGPFQAPSPFQLLVGFITDFLDTLGVGSFATTTALLRAGKSVDDSKLPGTLNVGHALPTILQALIFIEFVKIDMWTLWLLIIASILGAYGGASFVSRLPKRMIQIGMATALLIAVTLLIASLLKWTPKGGSELGLTGTYLAIGFVGNFIFGALMTIGVGAYAPIMIMVNLLGMNQETAFPLMMGSCGFLMPVASYRFIKSGMYDARAAIGLTLLGLPGVMVAAFIVKKLSSEGLNWLVVAVVIYTALSMLYAAFKPAASQPAASDKEPASLGDPGNDSGNPYQPPRGM